MVVALFFVKGYAVTTVSLPVIERPDIIVPDASPLIHLAQADALGLLHQIGGAVILVDVVADQITRDASKPGAQRLRDWITSGVKAGSNAPIRLVATDTGRAIALARMTDPDFMMRNGGENAIIDWLVDELHQSDVAIVVLYENGRVPKVVSAQALDGDIDVITTRAFLELAERRGLLPSAAAVWDRIVAAAATANPQVNVFS